MSRPNVATFVSASIIAVVLAWCSYDYLQRRSDWDEVQKAAFRVDSGLRHETLILLRSKVADLDAALEHYVAEGTHRSTENRVTSVRQAIESLEWALDHTEKETKEIQDGDEEFLYFEQRPYLNVEPNCYAPNGRLFLEGPELVRASLAYAHVALLAPDQAAKIRTADFSSLRTKCASATVVAQSRKQAATAEAKKESANLYEMLSRYVHQCPEYGAGEWCWSDPNDETYHYDNPFDSKEQALDDAVDFAERGYAFKNLSGRAKPPE